MIEIGLFLLVLLLLAVLLILPLILLRHLKKRLENRKWKQVTARVFRI